jgi:acyl dehydratase
MRGGGVSQLPCWLCGSHSRRTNVGVAIHTQEGVSLRVFAGLAELATSAGVDLGRTNWLSMEQTRIDDFARTTGDFQWIHVDTARAAVGPHGRTIAHGMLTLSLLTSFHDELYRVERVTMALNCGLNRVRFLEPVGVGDRLRASARIDHAVPMPGAVQLIISTDIELEGAPRPACVAESVFRYIE